MWKSLIAFVRDAFDLSSRVKGHDQKLERLFAADEETLAELYRLSERVLRLELELRHQQTQHTQELAHWQSQQTMERQNFQLQLENLVLRLQRGLPPPELSSAAESIQQPAEPALEQQGK